MANPFLYIMVLLLYSEGSYCKRTRTVARTLIVQYIMILVASSVLPPSESSVICIMVVCLTQVHCIVICEKWSGKAFYAVSGILHILFWTYIVKQDIWIDFSAFGWSFSDYSHLILREINVVGLSLASYLTARSIRVEDRDRHLTFVVVILYLFEYAY